MTVLVFDSGLGGLTVLREVRVRLPEHQFIYVGDDAGFSYGDWEEHALVAHIQALFADLIQAYKPSLAIIACNTASTLILPALRGQFSIPFVGTVPAIKPAAERTHSGLISVLGTPGTINRRYTQELIEQFAANIDVNLVAAPKLSRLAEDFMQGRGINRTLLWSEIAPCFVESGKARTDIVVLGCTHYPFLTNEMRKLAPWPVDWLDPAEAIAQHTVSLLDSTPVPAERSSDIAVLTSSNPSEGVLRLLQGFGLDTGEREPLTRN